MLPINNLTSPTQSNNTVYLVSVQQSSQNSYPMQTSPIRNLSRNQNLNNDKQQFKHKINKLQKVFESKYRIEIQKYIQVCIDVYTLNVSYITQLIIYRIKLIPNY